MLDFGFGDIMDAFFGTSASRGPRPRKRRGQDALIRLDVELGEAAFGSTRDLQVDTAVLCPTCTGAGTAPGTSVRTCDVCRGRGEVQQVQRSLLGQVMTSRPCPNCSGFGTVIPHPCPECAGDGRIRTRRTLTVKIPAGVDTGTRIQLAGEGEIGPGGGPAGDLFVEIVELPHPTFQRRGDDLHCTVTLPMTAAALGASVTLETLDGPRRSTSGRGLNPAMSSRSAGSGCSTCAASVAATCSCTSTSRRRPSSTASRNGCCGSWPTCAARNGPTGSSPPAVQGFFSRLRDAFNGR